MDCWAPERILKGRDIMDLNGNDLRDAYGFHHRCQIPRRNRIIRLGSTVFASIAQIWDNGGHTGSTRIAERAAKKQESTKFIISALAVVAVERMQHENIMPTDVAKWSCLVFSVLEHSLFVGREYNFEAVRNAFSEITTPVQSKKQKGTAVHPLGAAFIMVFLGSR